jgi:hypothetical protein
VPKDFSNEANTIGEETDLDLKEPDAQAE